MQNDLNAIILAAGKSGRLGEPKAFLQFEGKTFIINILEKLLSYCNKMVVVFGYQSARMIEMLSSEKIFRDKRDRIIIEVNQNYERGMFSSIQSGLKQVHNSNYILIHQVDQPGLPQKFYEEFVFQIDSNFDWLQPSYSGRVGHPIIINKKVVDLILAETIESNLRFLKNRYQLTQKIWECSYPEIHQDIDTIEDYLKLSKGI
jgi:molybdenum cofactor cytidylyltransferase